MQSALLKGMMMNTHDVVHDVHQDLGDVSILASRGMHFARFIRGLEGDEHLSSEEIVSPAQFFLLGSKPTPLPWHHCEQSPPCQLKVW
jgi:hypothetical protein